MDEITFEEYKKDYLEDVRINAQIDGILPDEYFFSDAIDKLSAMGELIDPIIKPTQKKCRNNRIMSFDAYAFDQSDKSFVLIANDFKDLADATLTKTEIETIRIRMLNFIQEAYDEKLSDYFDITDEMIPVGRDVSRRMKKDYVDLDNDDSIIQIKLFIVTNKTLSEKVISLRCDDFLGKKVELNVWSIKRFFDLYQSGKDREPILLEDKTLRKIMSYIGDPGESEGFSIRGLVVGDVQSGKTSNYLGLVTKAADAGYRVIIILTGTIEGLRRQTQERVEEGFVGYDVTNAMDVGVGRGDKTPKLFTSRLKDFVADDDQNTNIRISNYPSEPMVFVLKKNASVLKKLYSSLKNINTTKQYQKINAPLLLIDDEADNASINTRKADEDPTKINKNIRSILSLFTKSSYIGFTATPFANVFISYDSDDEMLRDDLFPRDFIYSLKAPSNYCGSRKYFFESNNNVRYIEDGDETLFPMKHKKDWCGEKLFDSLYSSINTFFIANAIRDIRDATIT